MTVEDPTASEEILPVLMGPAVGETRAQRIGINVALYAICIAGALALASILVLWSTDSSPWDVVHALYTGSLSDPAAIGLTLEQATPLLIVALGVIISTRAGVFTIGPEGQFLIGTTFAAYASLKFGLGPWPTIITALIAGIIGGALWAGIAAVLRYWRGVDVIISTLLLNFVAVEVVSFFVNKSWLLQEQTGKQVESPQSDRLAPDYQLPKLGELPGFSTTSAVFLAAVLVAVVTFALTRTRWGFRSRMLGLNPNAARAAGVSMVLVGGGALVLSGAFAGLAGAVWFQGMGYRLTVGAGGTMPGEGLLVALISRRNPLVAVPIALFFGVLRSGGGYLAATGVPSNIVQVVQALVVLAALLPPAILHVRERRRAVRVARRAAAVELESSKPVEVAA